MALSRKPGYLGRPAPIQGKRFGLAVGMALRFGESFLFVSAFFLRRQTPKEGDDALLRATGFWASLACGLAGKFYFPLGYVWAWPNPFLFKTLGGKMGIP
ncbi:hypothetical protein E2542_SST28380 [Spatholobus suberectus]|nr:hypothetical protein E2542_SST28380 [Spatholobus suberectus]